MDRKFDVQFLSLCGSLSICQTRFSLRYTLHVAGRLKKRKVAVVACSSLNCLGSVKCVCKVAEMVLLDRHSLKLVFSTTVC